MALTPEEEAVLETLVDPDEEVDNQFKWDEEFQRHILGMLLNSRYFLVQSMGLIKSVYFTDEVHRAICSNLFKYFEKYKELPKKTFLREEIETDLKNKRKDEKVIAHYQTELENVLEYYTPGLDSREYLLDKLTNFAKIQELKFAFGRSLELIKENPEGDSTWMKIHELLRKAMLVDRNFDVGLEYFQTFEERYKLIEDDKEGKEIFTSGFPKGIDEKLVAGGPARGEMYCWVGLCFAKNTKILMYDGTIKNVQDVQVGDLVMGDDSTSRKVLQLSSGHGPLYKVTPTKGEPYVVNENHILSLKNIRFKKHERRKRKDGSVYVKPNPTWGTHPSRMGDSNIHNISIKDYLVESDGFKANMKGWRTGVDFSFQEVKIDPYFLGLWLGDGNKESSAITNIDKEIIDAIYAEANSRELSIRKQGIQYHLHSAEQRIKPPGKSESKNTLQNHLREYNLLFSYRDPNNTAYKHIPLQYKCNSREVRLQLLAGLMDTDGSRSGAGFDFINKNKILAEDVVYIARSLGLAAYIRECKKKSQNGTEGIYWRVSISGDCSIIPNRIPRKKCSPRKQIKDVCITGIKVEPIGDGDFYGFSVDKNHLFLLGDFTVTHNSGSGKSLALVAAACANIVKYGKRVLYISLEMSEEMVADRFDAQLSNVGINNLHERKEIVFGALRDIADDNKEDSRLLVIKQFPGGEMDVSMLRAFATQLQLYGFIPDLVIIDYIGEMKDYPGVPTWESRYRIVRDLRGFAVEQNICIFSAMQPNKSAREAQKVGVIDDENLADAYGQIRPLDGCWSINQVQDEKDSGIARVFVIKHRHGKSRYPFWIQIDKDTLKMNEIAKETYQQRLGKLQNEKQIHSSDQTFTDLDKMSGDYRSEYGNNMQRDLGPGADSSSKDSDSESDEKNEKDD